MNLVKSSLIIVLALFAGVAAITYFNGTVNADTDPSTISDEALDQRIRDYILNHPEVIVESIQKWQAQQQQAQVQQAETALKTHHDEIFNDPDAPIGGNPDGDVTVVEFMDYNCGYCRKTFPVISQLLETNSTVRLVLKEFPVLGPGSVFAARAALASRQQGRYVEFHNAMMQSDQRLGEPEVLEIAERIGLDVEQLKKDMADPDIQSIINRNHQLAQALAINGTPSFVIGDEIVHGAVDLATLQRLVKETRQTQ